MYRSINGEEVQFLLKTQDGKLMQLSATPMIDSSTPVNVESQQTKPQTIVIKTAIPLKSNEVEKSIKKVNSSPLSDAKQVIFEITHYLTKYFKLITNTFSV